MVEPVAMQNRNYLNLLVHIYHEIKSLGFKVLVVGAGHYPLLDFARSAAALFHQEQAAPKMIVWAMTGYELVQGRFEPCGDHAGKWETSLLMHLDPGLQDLSLLPDDPAKPLVGATNNGVQGATDAFGREAANAIIETVRERVNAFLENTEIYQGHGAPM